MSAQAAAPYPLTFSVDYPDRDLNRVTTGFRLILAIPLFLLLALFGFGRAGFGELLSALDQASRGDTVSLEILVPYGSEGVLVLPDPNNFEGTVRLKRGRGGWEDVPYASRGTLVSVSTPAP